MWRRGRKSNPRPSGCNRSTSPENRAKIYCSSPFRDMSNLTSRIVRRFMAFKHDHKEKKEAKVTRLMKVIREKTGLSRGLSEEIADAIVRGREVERLAMQKGWPIEDQVIVGPEGEMPLSELSTS